MNLTTYQRKEKSKGSLNALRRKGDIPAILYSKGQEGTPFSVDGQEFRKVLRTIQKGTLSTVVFDLQGEGASSKVVVKGIQYHPTTYEVLHLDFMELHDDTKINVKIPIQCTHTADCVGVKAGGVLRQVIRAVKVRCLPKDLPSIFHMNVKNLGMKQSMRLKEIQFPEGVEAVTSLEEVAVIVAKR
jgi:large subunit ribosomal protein L25